jgi:ribosome biogenesis GTPase / thiamine phosphate phosphatase
VYLHALGWNEHFQEVWKSEERRFAPARVIEAQRGSWRVASEVGESAAEITGRLRYAAKHESEFPVVGDWVSAELFPTENKALIHQVLPRKTTLSRKAAHEVKEQVLVANVDTVLIVSSLNAEFNPRRLERYLGMIWESGAAPVVVLSKADLCANPWEIAARAEALAPSVRVHVISGLTGEGLTALMPYFGTGNTSVLVGSSGVGKSTMINALLHSEVQSTQGILGDSRGRHTTTSRRLFAMPSGGVLIDTPGIRELHLWEAGGLEDAFGEISRLATGCRFSDCRHQTEPGCAVREAVRNGDIDEERLANFDKLKRELDYLDRRHDPAALAEQRKRWKQIHKAMKREKRHRP